MSWSVVNLPNMLSWARLGATPVSVSYILNGQLQIAFYIFVAAGITDALDGFLARRFNLVSDFGRIIDPVADKALLTATYLALAYSGYLPWWLTGLVVGRDILIVSAYGVSGLFGVKIRPAPVAMSKFNTASQIALAAGVLFRDGFGIEMWGFIDLLIWLTAATTVLSWLQYLVLWITTRGTMQRQP
ncbi:MAG: CDP-alcohol phosphatidyltransferase family protein [Alphaproteobacteria bacterium]